MCRLLAHLGDPIDLYTLLYGFDVPFVRQAHAPRFQDVGRINADGWGVGWWDHAVRPEPARYRTVTPMWADARFREIAPLIRAEVVVAAMRNATPGAPIDESGNAPFASGPWLFAHNGFVNGFRGGLGVQLRRGVSEERDRQIMGAADSEVVFAMVLDRLDKGAPMADALAEVVTEITAITSGRLNLLLSDGHSVVATRWGNSLFTHPDGYVASEPLFEDDSWTEVPESSVVVRDPGGTTTTPSDLSLTATS